MSQKEIFVQFEMTQRLADTSGVSCWSEPEKLIMIFVRHLRWERDPAFMRRWRKTEKEVCVLGIIQRSETLRIPSEQAERERGKEKNRLFNIQSGRRAHNVPCDCQLAPQPAHANTDNPYTCTFRHDKRTHVFYRYARESISVERKLNL